MKTVLITGCAGFIGSNLSERLVELGWKVIGIDNLMNGKIENLSTIENNEHFTFIKGDIRNKEFLEKVIEEHKIEYISHQAARGSVPKSIEDPILTTDINLMGTLNILVVAKEKEIKKVVCAISSSIYGNTKKLPKEETMEYDPLSPYGLSKVANAVHVKQFYELYNLKTIGLIYFNVYGKHQDPEGAYAAVIPKWIDLAKKGEDLILNGDKPITRDFTYIADVVEANILALNCKNEESFGQNFNIGYSGRTNIKEVAEKIIKITKAHSKIITVEERPGDIQDSYADITKAENILGYKPQHNIWEGLEKTIPWYKKN